MTKRIKKFAKTLDYLATCDKHTGKAIIKSASKELLNCFSDICYNILKGRLDLSTNDKKKLSKHKSAIRTIANKKTTAQTKKQLIQRGGFLGSLLVPLLGGIIAPLAKGILGIK